jgi:hypothetical protein
MNYTALGRLLTAELTCMAEKGLAGLTSGGNISVEKKEPFLLRRGSYYMMNKTTFITGLLSPAFVVLKQSEIGRTTSSSDCMFRTSAQIYLKVKSYKMASPFDFI